jgi:hypothetical protein
MNDKLIAQLEEQLEYLIEGAFTNLFRKRLSTHDIALKLVRSMESSLRYEPTEISRPFAPDQYTILLHPEVQLSLQKSRPELSAMLAEHLIELAGEAGYRMAQKPTVNLLADPQIGRSEVTVIASHTSKEENPTQAMQRIPVQPAAPTPGCQLIVNGQKTLLFNETIINIGRSDDNHVILEDPFISRHHVQIRWRFGVYTLFDTNSSAGTRVNNTRVTEHRLRDGDVIQVGSSTILFIASENPAGPGTTQSMKPVDS